MSTIRATNFQHASATNPAIVLAADGSATANVSAINGGPLAGFRNAIINGNFDIWQRGTATFGQGYWADRWNAYLTAGVSMLQSRYTLTDAQRNIIGYEAVYAWQVLTGDITSSVQLQQPIEGVKTFAGSQVAVSFWAFTDAGTCTISSSVTQFFGTGGSPSASVDTPLTLSATTITTTPTKITAVVTLPSIAGKTLGTDADSVSLLIRKVAGASNRLRIAQVQVEAGPVATPFESRPRAAELALCQRYYEIGSTYWGGYGVPAAGCYHSVQWKAQKRITPILSFTGTPVNCSVFDMRNATVDQANWYSEATAAGGFAWNGTWTASAEL